MAFLKNGQDDDFFGSNEDDDDEEDCLFVPSSLLPSPGDGSNHHLLLDYGALARAESSALAERFRKIGFHEGYDPAKDERLQEGFETGYKEAFAVSTRIGIFLGEATLKSKLLPQHIVPPALISPVATADTTENQIQQIGNDGTSRSGKIDEGEILMPFPTEPIYLAAARQIIKRLTEQQQTDTLSTKKKSCDLMELENEVRNILLLQN
jgi:hypothetical protein